MRPHLWVKLVQQGRSSWSLPCCMAGPQWVMLLLLQPSSLLPLAFLLCIHLFCAVKAVDNDVTGPSALGYRCASASPLRIPVPGLLSPLAHTHTGTHPHTTCTHSIPLAPPHPAIPLTIAARGNAPGGGVGGLQEYDPAPTCDSSRPIPAGPVCTLPAARPGPAAHICTHCIAAGPAVRPTRLVRPRAAAAAANAAAAAAGRRGSNATAGLGGH